MQLGYSNALPDGCNEVEIIENYLEKILDERKKNAEKGIRKESVPSEEENIGNVAKYMIMRDFPREFTSKYNSICDEYDFLINPEDFDIDKFNMIWLFNYSNDLLVKLKGNSVQNKIIIEVIDKIFSDEQVNISQARRLFEIYKMMNDVYRDN